MRTLLTAGTVFTPTELIPNGAVLVEDGRIGEVGSAEALAVAADRRLDFPDDVLAPGFIDLHIHGAVGHDFMQADGAAFQKIGKFLARHGTTSYLPTTITAPEDELLPALASISTAIVAPPSGTDAAPCARPIGIHLEGPFISDVRHGVHPAANIQKPSVIALDRYVNAARGSIRVLTMAPELPHALPVITDARERGIVIAFGHTNASYEEAEKAIAAGVSYSTHTFNGMRRMIHRDAGVVGAILSNQRVYADIVADGFHVHPPVVDLFLRCKGRERAILISDATSAAGMPEGRYHLGHFEAEVEGLLVESHGKLAGSVLTLEIAVQKVMEFAGWPLHDALQLVTINPATLLGLKNKGRIAAGADADMVVLTGKGEVLRTFVGGQGI